MIDICRIIWVVVIYWVKCATYINSRFICVDSFFWNYRLQIWFDIEAIVDCWVVDECLLNTAVLGDCCDFLDWLWFVHLLVNYIELWSQRRNKKIVAASSSSEMFNKKRFVSQTTFDRYGNSIVKKVPIQERGI